MISTTLFFYIFSIRCGIGGLGCFNVLRVIENFQNNFSQTTFAIAAPTFLITIKLPINHCCFSWICKMELAGGTTGKKELRQQREKADFPAVG